MMSLAISAAIVLLLLVVVVLLLREKRPGPLPQGVAKPPIEEMFPLHCRYFPQIRQALSRVDQDYLRKRATWEIRRRLNAERRNVARDFLAGLYEDFSRLEQLGRTVAALAPTVSRKLEAERFWLGLQFRLLYRVVQARMMMGNASVPQLARLTELVGGLAAQIESTMAALEESSAAFVRPGLNP